MFHSNKEQTMTKLIYTAIACSLILGASSCRKYVEVDQPGQRELKFTSDYQGILDNRFDINTSYILPVIMNDDLEVTDPTLENRITGYIRNAWTWSADLFGDTEDLEWQRMYKQINRFNTITYYIGESQGGSEADKAHIKAQAQMHRAYTYFDLVNMYAKQYDAATASTDPGVPVLLSPSLEQSLKRASVKAVYEQIIKDLNEAIPNLPEQGEFVSRASKVAAFAVLARASLQMGNYNEALRFADSALKRKSSLLNMNNYLSTPLPTFLQHPEYIFMKAQASSSFVFYPLSQELQQIFDTKDLRWEMNTRDGATSPFPPVFNGRAYVRHRLTVDGNLIGPDVPEMMLIKAECLARTGKPGEAMDVINTLRQSRFRPADYVSFTATDANDALVKVLQERRRELMVRGLRWFDLKRLNKEPQFAKTLSKTFLGETYTLAPNSNRYVLPIASKYTSMNPELEPNPR
jgi:starch-binding outer membrane protein, SusD/RagB family